MSIATKLFLPILLLFISSFSFAQEVNAVTAEDLEFYRQVKLTKEFKAIRDSIEVFNADENNIPQEYKFEITRDKKHEANSDQYIYGLLTRKLVIMKMPVEAYYYTYDRHQKKIVSVKGGGSNIEVVK